MVSISKRAGATLGQVRSLKARVTQKLSWLPLRLLLFTFFRA